VTGPGEPRPPADGGPERGTPETPFDPGAVTDELQRTLGELHREQVFVQVLLENLNEGIIGCDAGGRITLLNAAARRLCGVPEPVDEAGIHVSDVPLRSADGRALDPRDDPLQRALAGDTVRDEEWTVRDAAGAERVLRVNAQVLFDERDEKLGAVAVLRDVSDQRRTEARLAELALHDPLTGVANRLLLADRLRHALDRMRRTQGGVAVLMLDLDDFKAVNDRYGHDVGDEVLVATARRLHDTVRPEDTVARLGGDEFVVICEVGGQRAEVEGITQRITAVLAEPYRVSGRVMLAEASVGAVLAAGPRDDPAVLLARADAEMYRAKARRRQARHRRGPRPA
jgi:diguanylate cyclase (GGDEF)-like protein/PAS domain S-box-containing protein